MNRIASDLIIALTTPARQPVTSLRLLLAVDGMVCLLSAVVLFATLSPLARLTGLPPSLLQAAALVLALVAVVLGLAARMARPPIAVAWTINAVNAGWVIASVAVLVMVPALTTAGTALVIAQALVIMATIIAYLRALAATAHADLLPG